jgi:uncharacterized protein (DUF4415 family)
VRPNSDFSKRRSHQAALPETHEVLEGFRAFGNGWQTKIDAALKEWLKNNRPA